MPVPFLLLALQAPGAEAPPARRAPSWKDFPVFVWRERHAGKPLPDELIEPFGGTLVMREEPVDWLREKGHAFLVFNAAGRSPLHLDADEAWNAKVERWIETQDEELLVRKPCLNDPEVHAELFATLERTLAARGGDHGLGLALGDEVSLTPNGDPFDLCRCGFCEAQWQEYARKYGWPERAPLTDEVRLALLEGDHTLLGPWLARRRFEQECLLDLLRALTERAERATRAPVGWLGIAGQTPFGGIDPTALLSFTALIECYRSDDTRELFLTTRPRSRPLGLWRDRVLDTLFLEQETPDGAAWLAWESWLRGSEGLVLWSDQELEERPELRQRLGAAIADIRRLRKSFPLALAPPPGKVALVHDADSRALSWLQDALLDGPTWPRRRASYQRQHGSAERRRKGWLRLVEDCGALPGSLSTRLLSRDPRAFSVLVLNDLQVLGEQDVRDLEALLDAGCTVILDGPLGRFDREGRPRTEDIAQRLRERAPERVLDAPRGIEDYPEQRLGASGGRLRAFLRALVPPWLELLGETPWLMSVQPSITYHFACSFGARPNPLLVIALPNLPSAKERRELLRDVPIELRAPAGWNCRQLHPPPEGGRERTLPAGDAAVFLLEKPGSSDDALPQAR